MSNRNVMRIVLTILIGGALFSGMMVFVTFDNMKHRADTHQQ
jgi:hypothetical protein